ncbi:hypothetical protein H6F80_22125 [Leptolyngbya sp. FACHB-711]|nr:hypothetical protein [Leptolyngbya sp. FACHB-711]
MVHDIRKRIYQQQHEVANTQITLIQSRLAVLKQLRTLEDQLYEQQKRGNSVSEEDFEQIRIARNLLAQGQDNEATTVVSEILQSTTTQARRRAADGLNPAETDLWHVAVNLDKSARNAIAEIEKKDPLNQIEQVQQFLVSLAGFSDQMRAEATFWSVRPLLYLVLLTGLTLIGLNTRYIEKGDAFGAKPMRDYLVLLLWGLSADAASRSLSSLQGQRQ